MRCVINRKRNHLRQKRLMRQIRRRNAWETQRNRNKRRVRHSREKARNFFKPAFSKVYTPILFSFEHNREGVLHFINNTYREYKEYRNGLLSFIMDDTVKMDLIAICLLLSLLNKLTFNNIKYIGTFPKDSSASNFMEESGFFDVMKSSRPKRKSRRFNNQMYLIGQNQIDTEQIGLSVQHAMAHIIGVEENFDPAYEIIVEICSNSVEHGNENTEEKNWLVSISYEVDRVHFIVSDNGQGILKTLHRKAKDLFRDVANVKSADDVLKGVFNKRYQSRTNEMNRHKGLPHVKECFENGEISNLNCLTNKVLYNFTSGQSFILKNEYQGCLFCWDVTKENYNKWIENEF